MKKSRIVLTLCTIISLVVVNDIVAQQPVKRLSDRDTIRNGIKAGLPWEKPAGKPNMEQMLRDSKSEAAAGRRKRFEAWQRKMDAERKKLIDEARGKDALSGNKTDDELFASISEDQKKTYNGIKSKRPID